MEITNRAASPILVLAAAVAASVLAAVLCVLGLREAWAAPAGDDTLRVELAALGERVEALAERLGEAPRGQEVARLELGDLRRRVEAIEGAERRRPAPPATSGGASSAASPEPEREARGPATPAAMSREEFDGLLRDVLAGGDVPDEDQARFWLAARSTGYVDELLAELEGAIAERPADVAARLELADAYVAKLLTVPAGPERGVWGTKAEAQWKTALELDPRSWDAQFRLAESLSYYPEFLNKTGAAIDGLERARELQETLATEPRHAQTYVLLARLYARDGRPDEALDALREGLARHPGDAELERALEDLEGR